MKKKHLLIIILFYTFTYVFSQHSSPAIYAPQVISPRISGLGSPFTTLEAGTDTLFTNPALFPFLTRRWSAAKLSISVNDDVFTSFNALTSDDKLKEFSNNLFEKDASHLNLNILGPLALSITDTNFGAGIFNRSIVSSSSSKKLVDYLLIGEELFLTGGYGIALLNNNTHKVSLGFQMKGFFQTHSYALKADKAFMENSSLSSFKTLPIELIIGLGLDLGFLYKYENLIFLGLTCRDIYTPLFVVPYNNFESYKKSLPAGKTIYKTLLPNISVGLGSMPIVFDMYKTLSSLSFYLDYRDMLFPIFNKEKSPLLNIAFGSELIFHKVLSLRLGLNECYPHLGVGLDFSYFQLEFSAFLKEQGNKVWQTPSINIDFAFLFEY